MPNILQCSGLRVALGAGAAAAYIALGAPSVEVAAQVVAESSSDILERQPARPEVKKGSIEPQLDPLSPYNQDFPPFWP